MYNYFYYSNETTIVVFLDYLNSTTIGDQFMFTYGGGHFTYLASLSGATDLTLSISHEGCMCYNTNQNVYVALFIYSESVKAQLKALRKESDSKPRCAHSTQILVSQRPQQPPLVSCPNHTLNSLHWSHDPITATTASIGLDDPIWASISLNDQITASTAYIGLDDPILASIGLNNPITASTASFGLQDQISASVASIGLYNPISASMTSFGLQDQISASIGLDNPITTSTTSIGLDDPIFGLNNPISASMDPLVSRTESWPP